MVKVSEILAQIDFGGLALPEFQRGYVWNRDQVRRLAQSLYRKYPVRGLLVWVTRTESASVRGDGALAPGVVKLLLDGQQRVTTLYGIIRGKPPRFFSGNSDAFTGLFFHVGDEAFEFYSAAKMKDNPLWISVTDLMQKGVASYLPQLLPLCESDNARLTLFMGRLNEVAAITNVDLHIDEIIGEDKTVDVVVDIFNKVNSGGTKLSKGDLALARVCAAWPEARQELLDQLAYWDNAGYGFRLDWLLRTITTILTGEAMFTALKDVEIARFKQGLADAERLVDYLLNLIASRLGLDHGAVLASPYSLSVMSRYLAERGGRLEDPRERDRLLFWYLHTVLWGRYAGATETVLNQDLELIDEPEGAIDRLIERLRLERGDLRVRASDFMSWSVSARFYPMLYLLTRVRRARDWNTGLELSRHLLGQKSRLHLHHIFPKALLYRHGYTKSEVNALANFTFLTQGTNLLVSDRDPAEYLAQFAAKDDASVASHWIPMDRSLWRVERYREFLDARRELLAQAANEFLDELLAGTAPQPMPATPPAGLGGATVVEEEDEETRLLRQVEAWVRANALPAGERDFPLIDPDTKDQLALLDLAWPDGLQPGLSDPVAILLNEPPETEAAASLAGYKFFIDVATFQTYVEREVLARESAVA